MSETTRKLRKFGEGCEGHKLIDWYHMYLGMDLAADAIEAVEAQVAEAAKRHEDLAAWCAETEARVAALEKMGRLGASPNGDDRTRGDMSPRGFDSPTPAAPTPPAPSAVPAPRGFRVGDKVRTDQGAEHTISDVAGDGHWLNGRLRESGIAYRWPAHRLTLVRAADAPEAPAEEDTGLVVQRIRDEATKPLHVEIEKLRGEVARLTKERAEARAISAATAERVRNETQIATELRKDLADARDRIASKDRSIEVMLAETRALREALDAERSGVATKLHDAGFNNVENLVGAYRFERAQADALRFSARTWFNEKGEPELLATAEEVTERRKAAAKELAALKSKPRFRTRKVTKADVEDFIAHDGRFYESLRALGFRRRVDGAK